MRRLILEAINSNENGENIRALDPASYRGIRAYDRVIPADKEWKEAMKDDLVAIW
jgi:hypothetical protein